MKHTNVILKTLALEHCYQLLIYLMLRVKWKLTTFVRQVSCVFSQQLGVIIFWYTLWSLVIAKDPKVHKTKLCTR